MAKEGSYPHSYDFAMKKPRVSPKMLTLKIPCKGTDAEALKVTVGNPGPDQVIYKMTISKPKKFKSPQEVTYGFVKPNDAVDIKIQPKKLKNSNDFCKFDGLNFEMAPMPKGDLWDPLLIWKLAKQIVRQSVVIKVEEETESEESEDE